MLRSFAALLATSAMLFGCGPTGPETPKDRIGSASAPIINGMPDTTHQAVVEILENCTGSSCTGECSGTIFLVQGSTGYALTAAHCCAPSGTAQDPQPAVPSELVQGDDASSQNVIAYEVADYAADPNYDGTTHDFCVVKFNGASASTPTIPLMTPALDNLMLNDLVDFVGYGVTDGVVPNNNSLRMHVKQPIDESLDALTLDYSQTTSGPCSGDSGGPALSPVNGIEYVAGVTSYGDQMCVSFGVSGRVSGVYNAFILAYVDGQPLMQSCQACRSAATSGQGACVSEATACLNDVDCSALVQCFNPCQSDLCDQSCRNAHPNGVALYQAINDCVCTTGCVTECASQCSMSTSSGSLAAGTGSGSSGNTTSASGAVSSGAGGGGGGGQQGSGGAGGAQVGGSGAAGEPRASTPPEVKGCSVGTPEGDARSAPGALFALLGAALLVGRRHKASGRRRGLCLKAS